MWAEVRGGGNEERARRFSGSRMGRTWEPETEGVGGSADWGLLARETEWMMH